MNLSRKWLATYTDITASSQEYADKMTLSGSKVELTHEPSVEIKNVVVGRVTEIVRHPNSDHLWICQIDVGKDEPVQIVTGAQNVSAMDLVPVALHKSRLPGGIKIEKGKLRGELSNGMLCSINELRLDLHDFPDAAQDGIFILHEDAEPGDDIRPIIGADDSIVEFEITNNRPDCLSMIGLARESAVTFGTQLTIPEPTVKGSGGDVSEHLSIAINSPDLCPRYTARMVKNIKIEPSPKWMRQRLRAAGVRPINNIVDITNYVMLEYGQPMHAFDYGCLAGGAIIVRTADSGETINTLDGTSRALTPDMLVIADAKKPIGVAGVMGGENSEITEKTTYAIFESANFNGISIRKTAIALGMRTDASSRFEKGLDPENTVAAVQRACELVELLGAGEVLDGIIDVTAQQFVPHTLELEAAKINRLLGTSIPDDYMVTTLQSLGFTVVGETVTVPSWRSDVEHYTDLAEEVARFWGYNIIEPTMFGGQTLAGGYTEKQISERRTGYLLRGMGFSEIYTYSFISPSAYDKIGLMADSIHRHSTVILNPLGEDTSVMRTIALPSMLDTLARNNSYRNTTVRLYEMARVYRPSGDILPDERLILMLGAYGDMDFFALKGCVEALLKEMRVTEISFSSTSDNPSYHPGRCADIYAGNVKIGVLGQIHPAVCKKYELRETYTTELDFDQMLDCRAAEGKYVSLPRFPSVARDIALVCDMAVTVAALTDCINRSGEKLLREVTLFDIYTGSQVPEGKKSVAFSLKLRSDEATLTDADADAATKNILALLSCELGAVIR